jgi:hypothetical protein
MVEQPEYEVLRTLDGVEFRKYPKLLVVMVESGGGDAAFDYLFRYISGNNRTRKKIPMTIPVITTEKVAMTAPVITNAESMAFVVPKQYTMETAPAPTDPAVHLVEIPERLLVVLRFGGYTPEQRVKEFQGRLVAILEKNKITMIGKPFLMRYNSPFSLGFMRRNEVAIQVESK